MCNICLGLNIAAFVFGQVAGGLLAHANFGTSFVAFIVDGLCASTSIAVLLVVLVRWAPVKSELDRKSSEMIHFVTCTFYLCSAFHLR